MKDEAQQPWEAEVRRVVETHEFDYDPAAWAGMEQLLDGAPPAAGGNAGSWWASAWKWLVPAGLILAGGIWWVMSRPVPPSLQGSLPVRTGKEEVQPDKNREAEAVLSDLPEQENTFDLGRAYTAPVQTIPVKKFRAIATADPDLPLVRFVLPPEVPLLPARPLPKTLAPMTVKGELLEIDFKRKRNRKSLFPEIFESY